MVPVATRILELSLQQTKLQNTSGMTLDTHQPWHLIPHQDTSIQASISSLSLAEQQTQSRHDVFDAMQRGALENVHERGIPAGNSTVDMLLTSSIAAVTFF